MKESDDDNTRTHVVLTRGTMVSHYRIIEKIGAGGMGEVYLAEDAKLNRTVALKFLSPYLCQDEDHRKRFTREAQAAAKLGHANIVAIHEVGEYQGRPWFSMENVEGTSLENLIEEGKLSQARIVELAVGVCNGLRKAHESGIVHRDIKPSNVIVDRDGCPRVLDFGLAVEREADKLTQTGSTLGTVGYMSPEQVEGEEVDARSDLFSLGVMLYELVTGRNPFRRDNQTATLKAILQDDYEPVTRYKSGVSDELQGVISKLLEKDPALRYQSASGVISDLKRVERASGSQDVSRLPGKLSGRMSRILIPGLIVVLIVMIMIFKPWRIEIESGHEAVAAENRLAVMYFDNLADPADSQSLGEIVANLLITDLSESEYVQVVSSQRLYDILKLLGKEGQKKIDRTVATQIAEKANAKWMLLGSILNMEPEIILTAQLIEVESGNSVASQRIVGQPGERIFPLVDKLTVEIKNDLSLPEDAIGEPDKSIADVTTNSLEAYRYYLEGVENIYKHYNQDARGQLRLALQHDSTFAMAYYRLSSLEPRPLRDSLTAKAVKYASKASKKEQIIIYSWDLHEQGEFTQAIEYVETNLPKYPEEKEFYSIIAYLYNHKLDQPYQAIPYLEKAIEIDPMFTAAYNELTYIYQELGEYDKSIWAINKYIEISPDEANPYDTRADLYAYNGNLNQAIESYEKALEIKPDFFYSIIKLGHMYLLNRDYDRADSVYRSLCSDSNPFRRSLGRSRLAYIPIYQGKFAEALEVMDDAIAAGKIEKDQFFGADVLSVMADVFEERNELALALTTVENAIAIFLEANPDEWLYFRHGYIRLLSNNGDFVKAQSEAEIFKNEIQEKDTTVIWAYWYAVGSIELAKGNYEESVTYFEKAAGDVTHFSAHYWLAISYLKSGRLSESVAEFERIMKRYDSGRAGSGIWAVKSHYYLGQAYEASGWNDKAIEQYETFLDIWKNADEGLESVADAKMRLDRLKGTP